MALRGALILSIVFAFLSVRSMALFGDRVGAALFGVAAILMFSYATDIRRHERAQQRRKP